MTFFGKCDSLAQRLGWVERNKSDRWLSSSALKLILWAWLVVGLGNAMRIPGFNHTIGSRFAGFCILYASLDLPHVLHICRHYLSFLWLLFFLNFRTFFKANNHSFMFSLSKLDLLIPIAKPKREGTDLKRTHWLKFIFKRCKTLGLKSKLQSPHLIQAKGERNWKLKRLPSVARTFFPSTCVSARHPLMTWQATCLPWDLIADKLKRRELACHVKRGKTFVVTRTATCKKKKKSTLPLLRPLPLDEETKSKKNQITFSFVWISFVSHQEYYLLCVCVLCIIIDQI